MPDFDFQLYLEFVQRNYSESQSLYTPTDVVLPLKVQWVEKVDRTSGEEENDRQSSQKIEQFLVLDGLRKYALGDDREHVILAGRPGSGKSMALQQLAVALAKEGQIPVLVRLKGDRSVSELIKAEFRRAKVRVTDDQIEDWLSADRLVLLLDGVNEIPTEKLRQDLAQFREDNLSVPMVFTTRDLAIGGDLRIGKRFEMKPLSPEQLREFVGRYLPGQGEQLLEQLRDRLKEISETPLLLKMLCDVFDPEKRQIPQNKGELFREFDRKYEKFKGLPAVSVDFRRFKSEVLQHLAFVMMTGDEGKPTELELTIDRTTAERAIENLVAGRVSNPGAKAKEWLEDLLEHHLLQVATDDRRVEFRHQLFQEYYAAEYLMSDHHRLLEWLVVKPNQQYSIFQQDYLNYLKWTETIAITLSLMKDKEDAVQVVEHALEVDLMLGARLAGEVRSGFQEETVGLIMKLPESQKIPQELIIYLMGETGSEYTICYLNSNLNESSFSANAAEALGMIRSDKATLVLIQFIEKLSHAKEYGHEIDVAMNLLSKIGSEKAISALIELTNSVDLLMRGMSADIISKTSLLEVIPTIIKLTEDDEPYISANATIALSRMHPEKCSSALLSLLENSNSSIRNDAIRSLLNIDSDLAIPALLRLLKNSDSHVRANAAYVLGKIGSEKVIDNLIEALYYIDYEYAGCAEVAEQWAREDQYAQINISTALGEIATSLKQKGDQVNAKKAINCLVKLFNNSNLDGKIYASIGLGATHSEQTISVLIRALDHPEEFMVMVAALVLSGIESEKVTNALEQSLVNCMDGEGSVFETILHSLSKTCGAKWLSKMWIRQLEYPCESYKSAILEIQSRYQFYNYEIEQQAKLRKADQPCCLEENRTSREGGGGDPSLPATTTYNVKELILVSEQQPIFNQYNPTIGVNYAAENSNPRIIQNIQQESKDTSLLAIVQIIQALEKKYTFVQDPQQAIDIIDAEFKSLEASRSPQWQNLLNVKRLYNGGKKAAVKVSEHFAQENVWFKGFVAFLEGVSEDVK